MKVDSNGDGCWHCNRCNQSSVRGDYRYMVLVQIQDATGMAYAVVLVRRYLVAKPRSSTSCLLET